MRAVAPLSAFRHAGCTNRLVYIGQTGRMLRERLLVLGSGVHAGSVPVADFIDLLSRHRGGHEATTRLFVAFSDSESLNFRP